jgi:hypothetical protein
VVFCAFSWRSSNPSRKSSLKNKKLIEIFEERISDTISCLWQTLRLRELFYSWGAKWATA